MPRGLDWKGTESREVLRGTCSGEGGTALSVPNPHCPALTPSVTDRLNMLTLPLVLYALNSLRNPRVLRMAKSNIETVYKSTLS